MISYILLLTVSISCDQISTKYQGKPLNSDQIRDLVIENKMQRSVPFHRDCLLYSGLAKRDSLITYLENGNAFVRNAFLEEGVTTSDALLSGFANELFRRISQKDQFDFVRSHVPKDINLSYNQTIYLVSLLTSLKSKADQEFFANQLIVNWKTIFGPPEGYPRKIHSLKYFAGFMCKYATVEDSDFYYEIYRVLRDEATQDLPAKEAIKKCVRLE